MNLKFFNSKKTTFKYLTLICIAFLLFFAIFLAIYSDAYYTCCSDDLLQYFKIEEDFILKLKTGNLSFYNFNCYLGASYFSDTYYIPLDIFTFITFVLSFFMNFEIAFGLTEMIKLLLGTLMFAYFLSLRKCSNKAIFVTSLLYFVCGYNTTIMAFSAFFSLAFYFPLSAVAIEKFKEGKRFFVTLCTTALIFYNFYLGCCTLIFMGVWFILSYFLDNTLREIKEKYSCSTSKALGIYIGNAFKQGFICIFYMVIGFIISAIILIPSLNYFLTDALERNDTSYNMWSFDASYPYTTISAKAMFARIFGETFTPTYSCNFYGFNNSYITDHISLYITITGLLIMLYVFNLKDRKSWVYRIALAFELVFLAFPIFYMIFSLNGAPYTRWVGMLNIFNLLIVAHVITETDFKFKFAGLLSIIRSLLLIACILVVANYYSSEVYDVNIFKFILGKDLKENSNISDVSDMTTDIYYMFVAIGIIAVLTVGSIEKINKKFNIIPYVFAGEVILGFGWMFGPKIYNYNVISLSNDKTILNDYLKEYFTNPYDDMYYRTHLCTNLTYDYVYSRSYTRTNLYLSDLRIFHSFYDASANDFAKLVYDSYGSSEEERNSKEMINQYSMFVHQLLATKYVVVDSSEIYPTYFPEEYYDFVVDDGNYASYESENYFPFMVYDTMNSQLGTFNNSKPHMFRQQLLLNSAYIDSSNLPVNSSNPKVIKKYYTQSNSTIKYDEYNEALDAIGYHISGQDYSKIDDIPERGIMHFYFDGGQGARTVELSEAYLEYEDGSWESTLDGYAFYDKIPKTIWLYNNSDIISLGDGEYHELTIEYTDYSEYDKFVDRMKKYGDLSLKINKSSLDVSYTRENDVDNIVALPIAYNDDWQINNDYELVSVNGGFLGIVVPAGEGETISFSLRFKPQYLKQSALLSCLGIVGFGIVLFVDVRRKKNEEDFNYCSLL